MFSWIRTVPTGLFSVENPPNPAVEIELLHHPKTGNKNYENFDAKSSNGFLSDTFYRLGFCCFVANAKTLAYGLRVFSVFIY